MPSKDPNFWPKTRPKKASRPRPAGCSDKVLSEGTGPTPRETDTWRSISLGRQSTAKNSKHLIGPAAGGTPGQSHDQGLAGRVPTDESRLKVSLFVPADLAYGKNGAGTVAPNATLIFDMELLDIVPSGKGESPPPPAPLRPKPRPRSVSARGCVRAMPDSAKPSCAFLQ